MRGDAQTSTGGKKSVRRHTVASYPVCPKPLPFLRQEGPPTDLSSSLADMFALLVRAVAAVHGTQDAVLAPEALHAEIIPHTSFASGPVPVTPAEEAQQQPCSFLNESLAPSISCTLEKPTAADAMAYIRPGSTILEIGARYGSVSCTLAALTANSGRVVSVEPDATVWPVLSANLASHNCSVRLLQGAIADAPLHLSRSKKSPYATHTATQLMQNERTRPSSSALVKTVVPAISFDELVSKTGLNFDTLVIDCEGCLPKLLQTYPQMLHRVHTIILEADYSRKPGTRGDLWCRLSGGKVCIDYDRDVFPKFVSAGLIEKKHRGADYVFQTPGK